MRNYWEITVGQTFRTLLLSMLIIGVAACGQTDKPEEEILPSVGTRAIIKRHGQEVFSEVSAVSNKIVSTEFYWQGELVSVRHYYRGLFTIGGAEGSTQFEVDFDETQLNSIFPLAVGKEASFGSNLKLIDRGEQIASWVHMQVIKKTNIQLKDGNEEVFVIDIASYPEGQGKTASRNDIVFFSPRLGMILKSVTQSGGEQSYWRVVAVEKPDQPRSVPTNKKRRSGTLMI